MVDTTAYGEIGRWTGFSLEFAWVLWDETGFCPLGTAVWLSADAPGPALLWHTPFSCNTARERVPLALHIDSDSGQPLDYWVSAWPCDPCIPGSVRLCSLFGVDPAV